MSYVNNKISRKVDMVVRDILYSAGYYQNNKS